MSNQKKIVHVVGTGTIGEPLIGLLTSKRDELGLDGVTFHKRTPLVTDRSKVIHLIKRGATLAVDPERKAGFEELGMSPTLTSEQALDEAAVVIDCTPVGNKNKEEIYSKYAGSGKVFIAQGSEFGFGKMYARGINDSALEPGKDEFLQVVSCNTHNISVLLKTLGLSDGQSGDNIVDGRFVCMRRSNDISQDSGFTPSPQLGTHKDSQFGTHHARDAHELFKTLGMELDLFSSAVKMNTQYMHIVQFDLRVKQPTTLDTVKNHLSENMQVALTEKKSTNSVFSFGRDYGHYGRILNQTVVYTPSLLVRDGREIFGTCFTPQDGNSLVSSVAAAVWGMDPERYNQRIQCLQPYFFDEV